MSRRRAARRRDRPKHYPYEAVPGSEIRDRTPTISATMRDAGSELDKADVRFYLYGQTRGLSHDARTERLFRSMGALSYGKHTVRVTAADGAGNRATRAWPFPVVKGD